MAFVAFFFLPDSPEKARFLNEEEKEIATARVISQVGVEGSKRTGGISLKDIGTALIDIRNWLTAVYCLPQPDPSSFTDHGTCHSSCTSPIISPSLQSPSSSHTPHRHEFPSINAQGLTAPPYLVAFLYCLASTYIADRTGQRGLAIMTPPLVGAIGYIVLAIVKATGPRHFAVYLVAAGIFPAVFNIAPWTLNNLRSDSGRGTGIALLQMVGQCGAARASARNETVSCGRGGVLC
jgi:hypothetical protein